MSKRRQKKLKHERKEMSDPGINTKRTRNKKKNLGGEELGTCRRDQGQQQRVWFRNNLELVIIQIKIPLDCC